MRYFRSIILFLIAACGSPNNEGVKVSNQFVSIVSNPSITLPANVSDTLSLLFKIDQGYHIQSHVVRDENLVETNFVLNNPEPREIITEVVYPVSKEIQLDNSDSIDVYDGLIEFKIPLTVQTEIKGTKSYKVPCKLLYQACDDNTCFFPRILEFELAVNVVE